MQEKEFRKLCVCRFRPVREVVLLINDKCDTEVWGKETIRVRMGWEGEEYNGPKGGKKRSSVR